MWRLRDWVSQSNGTRFRADRVAIAAAKATREALTHFKFRTCTLLDIFLRKHAASPLLPGMLLPLLRALAAAHAPEPQVSVTQRDISS
jgi:hypothetical protein